MSALPQHDGPPITSDILVEIFDPAEFPASAAPGIEGRLRPHPYAPPLDCKVLVMADDILLRLVLAESLGFAGVGVVEAADAPEAAEILADRPDIGLLLADVSVPGRVDDLDLAWRCSVEHPDLPLVMMSALIEPDSMEIPPDAMFIRKPFTPDLLVQVIRPLLSGRPRPA